MVHKGRCSQKAEEHITGVCQPGKGLLALYTPKAGWPWEGELGRRRQAGHQVSKEHTGSPGIDLP